MTQENNIRTLQHKMDSGFNHNSTAEDVLRDLDLSGQLAIVTGGYSGLGLETTRALVNAGARVVVTARRPAVAKEALSGLEGVEIDALDLADLSSVRAFAERFLASDRNIDMLILNAGIMACPETRVGPCWEAQFATNHLGHFALTNLLWPALASQGGHVLFPWHQRDIISHRFVGMTFNLNKVMRNSLPMDSPKQQRFYSALSWIVEVQSTEYGLSQFIQAEL